MYMKARSAHSESKSLKTFLLYFSIVVFFIALSLGIKAYFLLQESRFDGEHEFILAIATEDRVEELLLFHPVDRTLTEISLEGASIKVPALGSILGMIPDAYVVSSKDLASSDPVGTMREIAWKLPSTDTNLTIFDAFRLLFASQRAAHKQEKASIVVSKESELVDEQINNVFVDDTIFSENVSIQIINASNEPGLGRRLERVLKHLGGNIIDVSSAKTEEERSKVSYYGERSYTLTKLARLLDFAVEESTNKTIADIIIIIGNDTL